MFISMLPSMVAIPHVKYMAGVFGSVGMLNFIISTIFILHAQHYLKEKASCKINNISTV